MTLRLQPCAPGSFPYLARLTGADGSAVAGLTRDEAEQLRDDLTVALRRDQQPSSTLLLACRLHDEARAMRDTG